MNIIVYIYIYVYMSLGARKYVGWISGSLDPPLFVSVFVSARTLSASAYVSASVCVCLRICVCLRVREDHRPPLRVYLSLCLCVCLRICVCLRVRKRVCARVLSLAPGRNSIVYGGGGTRPQAIKAMAQFTLYGTNPNGMESPSFTPFSFFKRLPLDAFAHRTWNAGLAKASATWPCLTRTTYSQHLGRGGRGVGGGWEGGGRGWEGVGGGFGGGGPFLCASKIFVGPFAKGILRWASFWFGYFAKNWLYFLQPQNPEMNRTNKSLKNQTTSKNSEG